MKLLKVPRELQALVHWSACKSHSFKLDPQHVFSDILLAAVSSQELVDMSNIHVVFVVDVIGNDTNWVPITV
jgi:hypothetical protein